MLDLNTQFMKGFTLIEFLLYIGLTMMMLVLFSGVAIEILESKEKTGSLMEVHYNSERIFNKIITAVQESEAVAAPTADIPTDILSLQTNNPDTNPTVFDIFEGSLRMKEGTSEAVLISTPSVVVSDISFEYTSYENTPGSVQIKMNISVPSNPNTKYSFQTTARIKK